MGCGDGSWMQHTWNLIRTRTERGRLMRVHPGDPTYVPLMVGADFNEAARRATQQHLDHAKVPHLIVPGDINDPGALRERLALERIDSRDLLHTNSFLIHNRPYFPPQQLPARQPHISGPESYCWRGRAVPNAELRQNLVELFRRWANTIGSHGMLVLELHDPECPVPGKTLTNYMLTHGLSDQFTVPLRTFLDAARTAHLQSDPDLHRHYPSDPELATISVNHFRVGKAPARSSATVDASSS